MMDIVSPRLPNCPRIEHALQVEGGFLNESEDNERFDQNFTEVCPINHFPMSNQQDPVRTLIVGHIGQLPFVYEELKQAVLVTISDPDQEAGLIWESCDALDKTFIWLEHSGKVYHHRITAIQTRAAEESTALETRLAELEEIDNFGFDHPWELTR